MSLQQVATSVRYIAQVQRFLKRQYALIELGNGKIALSQTKEEVPLQGLQLAGDAAQPALNLTSKLTIYLPCQPINYRSAFLAHVSMLSLKTDNASFQKVETFCGQEVYIAVVQNLLICRVIAGTKDKQEQRLFYMLPHTVTQIRSSYDNFVLQLFNSDQELSRFVFSSQQELTQFADAYYTALQAQGQEVELKSGIYKPSSAQFADDQPVFKAILHQFYDKEESGAFLFYIPFGSGVDVQLAIIGERVYLTKDETVIMTLNASSIMTIVIQSRNKQIVLEILNESVLMFQFESQECADEFQLLLASTLTKLKVAFRLRYYQISERFKIVNAPLQSCVYNDYLKLVDLTSNAAFLLRNYPVSLPLEMKNKDTVALTLQALQQASSENETCLLCDFLIFLISSRAMYLTIVQQCYEKLIYVLNKLILGHSRMLKCMGLLLLRNTLSFHFQCYLLGENLFYNGFQSSYALGSNYLRAFRELQFDPVLKHQNYELLQFSAKNNIEVNAFTQDNVQIDSTMIQSATFGRSRVEAERENRQFLADRKDILQMLDALADEYETLPKMCSFLLLGIIEDVLLSHHHLDQKYFAEELKKSELYLPQYRKELTFTTSKIAEFLVDYSVDKIACLRQSAQLLLKTAMHESILYQQQKLDIIQIIMQSSSIMNYFCMLLNEQDRISLVIVAALFGMLYHYSPMVQQMAKQIFYPAQLQQIEPIIIAPTKFSYQAFNSLFANGYASCQLFIENVFQNVSSIRAVWDESVRQGITRQITDQIKAYRQHALQDGTNTAWNYQTFFITHRGLSEHQYTHFGFAVHTCVFSELLRLITPEMSLLLQGDITELLVQKYVAKQAVSLPDGQNLLESLADIELLELIKCLFAIYIDIDEIDVKCAALYFMQPLFLLASTRAGFYQQLLHEMTNSVEKKYLLLNLYELKLLESISFQTNPSDPEKLMFWATLQKDQFIIILSEQLIPAVMSDGQQQFSSPVGELSDFYEDQSYGNLMCTALRVLRNCLQYVPCVDKFNQLLIPSPRIYQNCQREHFLPLLLGIISETYKTKKQYENSNVEDYIYSQQKYDAPLSPIRCKDVDYCKQIFIICATILRLLAQNDAEMRTIIVKHGALELLLQNPFDAQSNIEVFALIKILLAAPYVKRIIEEYLTFPFAYYIEKQKAASSANIFCCANYLSMSCIWSRWQRQWLRQQLQEKAGDANWREIGAFRCMWFEDGSEHLKLEKYAFLLQYEQFRVYNMYICLLDIYWFTAIFQATSSDDVKFPSSTDTMLLKSTSIEDNNVFRHKQMLQTMRNQISLEDLQHVLLALLDCDSELALTEIQDIKFEILIDSPRQFVYQAFSCVISAFCEKLESELVVIEQLFLLEQDLQTQICAHRARFGGTAKYIIAKLGIQDPVSLRGRREAQIMLIARIMLIVQKIAHSLYIQLQKFDEIKFTFEQLNGFFKLVNDVVACEFYDPFQRLMKFSTNQALQRDLQYCMQYLLMYNDFRLVMRESLLRFVDYVAKQLDTSATDPDLFICYGTVMTLASSVVDASNYDKIQCHTQLARILEAQYPALTELTRNAIIHPTMQLLARLAQFDEAHLSITETAMPYFNVIAVLEGDEAAAQMMFRMRKSYAQNKDIKSFIDRLGPLSFCLKTAKTEAELAVLSTSSFYTSQCVYNQNVRRFYAQTLIMAISSPDRYQKSIGIHEFLANDCFIGDTSLAATIALFLYQFTIENNVFIVHQPGKVNYAAQLQTTSDNEQLLKQITYFIIKYSALFFGIHKNTDSVDPLLIQGQDQAKLVPLLCALNVALQLHVQGGKQNSEVPDGFLNCLFYLAVQLSQTELGEQVSVLAVLLLIQICTQQQIGDSFMAYYAHVYHLLLQRNEVAIDFALPNLKLDNSPLQERVRAISLSSGLTNLPLLSRYCYLEYLCTEVFVSGAELENFDILQLNIFLQNVTREDNSEDKHFMLLSSLKALRKLILKSQMLQNILPRQLQYAVLQGDLQYIQDFMQLKTLSPCAVFSASICQEFCTKVQSTAQLVIQQGINTEIPIPASFFQFVDSLDQEYYSKGVVIADIVLTLYLQKPEQCVPDAPRFVNELLERIIGYDKVRYSMLVLMYLRALSQTLTNQPEVSQLLANSEHVQSFLNVFLIENAFAALVPADQRDVMFELFFNALDHLSLFAEDSAANVSPEFVAQLFQIAEPLIFAEEELMLTKYIPNILKFLVTRMQMQAYRLPLCRMCYITNVFCPDFFFRNLQTEDKQIKRLLLLGFSVCYTKSTDFQQLFNQSPSNIALVREACQALTIPVGENAAVLLDPLAEFPMQKPIDIQKRLNTFSQEDLSYALDNYTKCRTLSASHQALMYGITPKSTQQINFPNIACGESIRLATKCLWTLEQGEGWTQLSMQIPE